MRDEKIRSIQPTMTTARSWRGLPTSPARPSATTKRRTARRSACSKPFPQAFRGLRRHSRPLPCRGLLRRRPYPAWHDEGRGVSRRRWRPVQGRPRPCPPRRSVPDRPVARPPPRLSGRADRGASGVRAGDADGVGGTGSVRFGALV